MKSKGIRIEVQDILDKELVPVELPDILAEIRQGNKLHWAILYLEAGHHDLEEQVSDSGSGYFISLDRPL